MDLAPVDRPPAKHNRSGYAAGCRCGTCEEAHRLYMREYMRGYRLGIRAADRA